MPQHIASLALVVRDYDEAIAYYTATLGFTLLEDTDMGGGKRWVRVAPPGGETSTDLLLAKAKNAEELSRVGNQTGGRVFLFLHTDDIRRDYALYQSRGVTFSEPALREEAYGTVIVFTDLYGNKWDLVQRKG
jgi:catechol 2,3-dioxygenase-like lactoylglutathione lyase family enzyme